MPVRRLNHAVLYVRDVAASVAFYQDALGFETAVEIPGRAAFLRSPESLNDHDLGLFGIGATAGAPEKPQVGLYHLAWEVGTLGELASIRRSLSALGALVGASDHQVSKSLYAKDPDGIEFEVMWRVPVADRLPSPVAVAPQPLDLEADLERWGELPTGAAAGSPT